MKLWDLSVKKPVTVLMAIVCLLVLGGISLQRLKLAFLPKVDFPGIWVMASYPNYNPLILEREVTKKLEEGLSTIKGVRKVSSSTSADNVRVRLEFDWGMELDLVRLEVGLKLEEIKPELMEGLRFIEIHSFNTDEIPVIQGRISAPGIDLSENYDLLEKHIQQKIERIPGVAKVELGGVLPKEVSIDLRLDKIKEHDVDVGEVVRNLSRDNLNLSAGKVHANGLTYNIRGQGKIVDLEQFGETRVNAQGMRLKDIAEIYYEEPPIGYKRHLDGAAALAIEVYKESNANTVDVSTQVNHIINTEIAEDPVLDGITLLVWGDQGEDITSGLQGLTEAGYYGAFFAVFVLFLFLRRLDATLVVATAIPISIVGSFLFLYAFGFTLNILTMMGLMLAVGMLVDNAVVVLESIYQKYMDGLDPVEATREGTREVIVALIAATMTTVIVFLSLVFADDNELGVWLSSIGLTICITLGLSLLVSTTAIPLFASKLLGKHRGKEQVKNPFFMKYYAGILNWSLRHPIMTAIGMIVIILSVGFPATQLDRFKGTSGKTNRLFFRYEYQDYFFLSESEKVVNQVEAFLETKREEWEVESIYSYMEANVGQTTINFEDEHMPVERFREIRKQLREELPDIAGVKFLIGDDDEEGGMAIRVQLFGTETEILKETGERVAALMRDIEGLEDIRNGEKANQKELRVTIDREKANELGVTPAQVAETFGFTLRYQYLPRFQVGERETDVTFGLSIKDRAYIHQVEQIPMGQGVRLGSIAKFEFVDRPDSIRRVDRKAHHVVRATYEGKSPQEAWDAIEARLDNFDFPAGVTWSKSNRLIEDEQEMNDLAINVLLALLLVYLVMASLFESLIQPLMIFSTIVFSLVGVGWCLFLTQTEFQVMAGIGVLILIGIVVNNGIIMMDRINQYTEKGWVLKEAVRQGALDRIRPILMTASTTIIGLIPMAVGNSSLGGGYYFPLARTVIGGLASSTLLTLVGLPLIILTTAWVWKITKRAAGLFAQFVVRQYRKFVPRKPELPTPAA
ncbi:efflux RND transporter permease subunit [Acanthopleuribacter pedis]|uniref:Efflux RND transporter permease subunit n=1 Tax=Acanthopleuribacter pedis TaxID=442870 RepID=A0A8J7U691_9BACT|nr:efflux RND transporter permease subunit [Acanthopleuribacter pedis]MBO1321674.1 efflux RND transporter permease subunit [Acanthopleuribacter pedis]